MTIQIFKFGVHKHILEIVKVHLLDDGISHNELETLYSLFGDFLLILRLFKDVAFTFIGRETLQICYVPNMETNMKLKCM